MGYLDYIGAYLRTSRAEYLIAEVPGLLAVLFIGASSFSRLFAPVVLEGIAVFILLYFMGFILNAYTDQEIDKNYTIFKNRIPQAVRLIGNRNIRLVIVAQIALAAVLTVHISWTMGSWLPAVLMPVGVFFGVGYSIPPLQFKVRGWLHALSLILSAFFIPAVFLYFTIAGSLALAPMMIILGFSILHYGIAFANQAIDYLEDKAGGVNSPPVLWGMEKSLKVALAVSFAGALVEFAGLYYFIVPSQAQLLGLSGAPLFMLLVPVVLVGYWIPVSGLVKMYRSVLSRPIEDAVGYMKDICHYTVWQASGITGLMAAVGLVFFGGLL